MTDTLDTYLCSYFHDGEILYFKCQAEDAKHAEEQLLDAEPLAVDPYCEILSRAGNTND